MLTVVYYSCTLQNNTNNGIFEISTGELDNGESIGQILKWNNNTHLSLWNVDNLEK